MQVKKTTKDVTLLESQDKISQSLVKQYPRLAAVIPIKPQITEFKPLSLKTDPFIQSNMTIYEKPPKHVPVYYKHTFYIPNKVLTPQNESNEKNSQTLARAPTATTSENIPIKDFLKFSNQTTVLPLAKLRQR